MEALLIAAGLILGLMSYQFTRVAILDRSGTPAKGMMLESTVGWAVWATAGTAIAILTMFLMGLNLRSLEILIVLAIISSLSVIDQKIRKIANELLGSLLLVKSVFMIYQGNTAELKTALIGMAVGFILFQLPAMLRISIGWGDIKYAAVIGFYLGIGGLFQAIAIMSLILAIYTVYLYLTKKGGLKTKAPMGPAFSAGFMISILFPFVANYL